MIKKLSTKRSSLEVEIRKAKKEVREDQFHRCQSCRKPTDEVSHNYPVKHFIWVAAEKGNMNLLCRTHHRAFEENRFFEMNEGLVKKIIGDMWEMALEEEDLVRRDMMKSHIVNKVFKCSDFEEGREIANKLFKLIDQ